MNRSITTKFLLLFLLTIILIGCSTGNQFYSTATLPVTLKIGPPAKDLSPELSAFSGIWGGKWSGALDTLLVVENVDKNNADIILSLGSNILIILYPQDRFDYIRATVVDNSTIEWTQRSGSKFVFNIDKNLNEIHGIFIGSTGSKTYANLRRIESIENIVKRPDTNLKRIESADDVLMRPENIIANLELGEWGWIDYEESNCTNNSHKIKFNEDKTKVTFDFQKPFKGADDNFTNIYHYDVINIKRGRITMSLFGEKRTDSNGNPVIWDLIMDDSNTYSWYRHDWLLDDRTKRIQRCKKI